MSDAVTMNSTPARAGRRGIKWVAAGLALAISATVAVSAWAMPHGGHHGGMGGSGMFMGSPERMGRGLDRLLDDVKASDAQRTQIKQIVQQAAVDMKGQRETGRALREKAMEVFTAPNVDAAAAESLRQQMLAQHDAGSRRMLQAMLDVSRVLTPEQRTTLAEQMKQRQQRMQERMQQRLQSERPKQ